MTGTKVLFTCFISTAAILSLVNTVKTEDLIEFLSQDPGSVHSMTYGFQLLEDIRQIRMVCEERRDELEQHVTTELQNWMKYAQQTQQIDDRYVPENPQIIKETIANTYKEIYSSRRRRLNVIEHQCDDSLEELLNQRKLSMLTLAIDLMSHNIDKLHSLVEELSSYKNKLEDGLEICIAEKTRQYESRLSSKVLPAEDYCAGPDIRILITFLDHMLDVIVKEQEQFFGDDEDLGVETPCAVSGCGAFKNPPLHTSTPPKVTVDTAPTKPPSSPPFSGPSTSEIPTTVYDDEHITSPPSRSPTEHESATVTSQNTDAQTTQITSISRSPESEKSTLSTEPSTTASDIISRPLTASRAEEDDRVISTMEMETEKDIVTDFQTDPSQVPDWLDDAVNEVFYPQKQAQTHSEEDIPEETGAVSRNRHPDKDSHHHHNPEEDTEHSTKSRHRPNRIGEKAQQSADTDTDSGNSINRPLIYSFTTVAGILLVATMVIAAAILLVQRKRRQLLAQHPFLEDQKIAIMKETGYVNPTYKFFDKQNDE